MDSVQGKSSSRASCRCRRRVVPPPKTALTTHYLKNPQNISLPVVDDSILVNDHLSTASKFSS